MITVDITLPSGEIATNGVLMIFSLNGSAYAATIRVRDDGTPYPADVELYAAEIHEDDTFTLYKISSQEEYAAAADAFSRIQEYL